MKPEEPEHLDLSEKGRAGDGRVISSDRRLFMQLLAYGGCPDNAPVIAALAESGLDAVLYQDINDPNTPCSAAPTPWVMNRIWSRP